MSCSKYGIPTTPLVANQSHIKEGWVYISNPVDGAEAGAYYWLKTICPPNFQNLYNDLMTRYQILTSKAKSMATEPYTHQTPLHPPAPPTHDEDRDLSGDEETHSCHRKKQEKVVVRVHT